MPTDVAARIDAALAAERPPTFVAGGNIVPMRSRRSWWRSPNLAAAAAGVAILALGGALLVGHIGGASPSSGADKAANPVGSVHAPAASSGLKQFQTGANYTLANRAALVSSLVVGNAPPLPSQPSVSSPAGGGNPSPAPTSPTAANGPSYDRVALRQTANVYACAKLLAGHPVQPIAADYARYEGVPAVILVLPGLQNPTTRLDVYVIRTTCSDVAGDISYFFVPRPS